MNKLPIIIGSVVWNDVGLQGTVLLFATGVQFGTTMAYLEVVVGTVPHSQRIANVKDLIVDDVHANVNNLRTVIYTKETAAGLPLVGVLPLYQLMMSLKLILMCGRLCVLL